jgi:hypothetical protein
MAALLWAGDEACASHETAARLHGLEGIPPSPKIHITTARDKRLRTKELIVHLTSESLRGQCRHLSGILTTDVPRTLLDLSAIHPIETVEITLDDALRKGLVSIDYLDRRLATMSGRGQRGCRNLRAMLLERRDVAIQESVVNTKCWRVLKKSKVMQPTCEYRLLRPNGEFVKRFDFAYPLARTAVEAHSRLYHSGGRDIFDREGDKHNEVIDEGWLVLYFTWKHLAEGGKGFLTRLDSVLMDRMGAMRLLRP